MACSGMQLVTRSLLGPQKSHQRACIARRLIHSQTDEKGDLWLRMNARRASWKQLVASPTWATAKRSFTFHYPAGPQAKKKTGAQPTCAHAQPSPAAEPGNSTPDEGAMVVTRSCSLLQHSFLGGTRTATGRPASTLPASAWLRTRLGSALPSGWTCTCRHVRLLLPRHTGHVCRAERQQAASRACMSPTGIGTGTGPGTGTGL